MLLHDNEMIDLVHDYHAKGYQLAVHAIGDAAIEQTLNAFELARSTPGPTRTAATASSTQAMQGRTRMPAWSPRRSAGAAACVHLRFRRSLHFRCGRDRAKPSYPLKTWIDLGFKPAAGSDAPVCDINPFPNFFSMLTRKTSKGTVMDEREARLHRRGHRGVHGVRSIRQQGRARTGSRLVPGLAGGCRGVLARHADGSPEEILHDTRCDLTIRGGEIVFDRHGETAR